jgi:hypothetical protein
MSGLRLATSSAQPNADCSRLGASDAVVTTLVEASYAQYVVSFEVDGNRSPTHTRPCRMRSAARDSAPSSGGFNYGSRAYVCL